MTRPNFALTLATALLSLAHASPAQQSKAPANCPIRVGEHATYTVKYGPARVGNAYVTTAADTLHGRNVWRLGLRLVAGVPFYRINDLTESWFDPDSMHALRFMQTLREGSRKYDRLYEFHSDRNVYVARDGIERLMSPHPLDDVSFLFFMRTQPLDIGRTYEFARYFRPDANPVRVKVLRRERVEVPAGVFNAIVLQPSIKTNGLFREGGRAEVWLADDSTRQLLRLNASVTFGSLSISLRSVEYDSTATHARRTCAGPVK